METNHTQEERRWESQDYDIMRDLSMSKELYLRWWDRGLTRCLVDPEDSNSPEVYIRKSDLKAIVSYYTAIQEQLVADNRVLAARLRATPEPIVTKERVVKAPPAPKELPTVSDGQGSKGLTAYTLKAQGVAWVDIPVKSALHSARSYAKTHKLPWPPIGS
jgi:hypothetical protein